MRHKIATLTLSGVLAGTLGTAVLVSPTVASAQSSQPRSSAPSSSERHPAPSVKKVLDALVKAETITQKQADKVASALEQVHKERRTRRHRERAHAALGRVAPKAIAKAIGISVEQLRTELRKGVSVTAVANGHGVDRDTLVSKLVTDAEARLSTAVKEGKLTQAQVDKRKATLGDRIGAAVDRVHQERPGIDAPPPPRGPAPDQPSIDLGGAPDAGAPQPT